jgi:hypothetical protein
MVYYSIIKRNEIGSFTGKWKRQRLSHLAQEARGKRHESRGEQKGDCREENGSRGREGMKG